MVWPSVQYPLPAMMIMEEESESITKKLYAQLIPSGGGGLIAIFLVFSDMHQIPFLALLFLGQLMTSLLAK
jgi:hypothetical protein